LQFPNGPLFSESDAETLNTTYIPSTQQAILGNLNSLQAGKAFFESVNNAPLFLISFCHWVGTLAEENNVFFNLLIASAPVRAYASKFQRPPLLTNLQQTAYQPFWEKLQTEAATQYGFWLSPNGDGFQCGGKF
jgi:hypothetical protein